MAPLGTIQNQNVGIQPEKFRLPPASHVGRVRLAVSDLASSISFYTQVIGLVVLSQHDALAQLGTAGSSRVLLELQQMAGVQPIIRRTRLGLYHSAFLLPNRESLSSFIAHLIAEGINFGSGDHIYSEAIYLVDPDGLSVEVYADRDRKLWIYEGREIVSATNPVDLDGLLALSHEQWKGAPAGTVMGHVHMYVGDLDRAAHFYHATLGFDIVTWRYPGALFLSAGGYHHDIAVNVWAAGSPQASPADARLLFWELVLPDADTRARAEQSLIEAGCKRTQVPTGDPGYTDAWGIKVSLALEQA